MRKKILIMLMLSVSLFALAGCGKEEHELTDAQKFKEEYESINGTTREKDGQTIRSIEIPEENPFVYKEASDIVKMIENKETFAVYFGFSDCPWCRSVVPTLIEVANDLNLDTIYYVDVKTIRDTLEIDKNGNVQTKEEGSAAYYQLLELLKDVLSDYNLKDADGKSVETNEKRIGAPNVIAIVNGEARELETGISDEQKNGYQKLTDAMKKETYEKFKCVLKCVVEANKSCSYNENGC